MSVLWLQPPTDWSIEAHQDSVYYSCKYRKWLQWLHTHAAPPRGRQVKAPPTKHDNTGVICICTVFIWGSDLSSFQHVCFIQGVLLLHTHALTRVPPTAFHFTQCDLYACVCVWESDASGLRGILMTFIQHRIEHANLSILHSHISHALNCV